MRAYGRGLEAPRGPGGRPHDTAKTLPPLVAWIADWISRISGQGSVSLTSPELADGALLFYDRIA